MESVRNYSIFEFLIQYKYIIFLIMCIFSKTDTNTFIFNIITRYQFLILDIILFQIILTIFLNQLFF